MRQRDGSEIIPPDDAVFSEPALGNRGTWPPERLRRIPQYKEQIVVGLASGMFPSEICLTIGMTTRTYKNWREQDQEFDQACDEAIEAALDRVEREAIRRAVDGISDVVVSNGRVIMDPTDPTKPLMQRKYSDVLMMFLLKGRRREVFGDEAKPEAKQSMNLDSIKDELSRKLGALLPPPGPDGPTENS